MGVSSMQYARIEEWDPEEKKHRQAQFLIYKTLKHAEHLYNPKPPAGCLLRLRISKQLRLKIGSRLKRLRLGLAKARAGLFRHVATRLFHAGQCATAAATPSSAAPLPRPVVA